MSERPREHAPLDSSIAASHDSSQRQRHQNTPASNEPHRYGPPSSAATTPSTVPPAAYWQPAGNGRSIELPPLQVSNAPGGAFPAASRSAGVSSILNPTEPDDGVPSRRRKASELESPRTVSSSSSYPTLPPLATGGQAFPPSNEAMILAGPYPGERHPRRVLTPRSPYRAVSLNQLNPPSATLSANSVQFAVSPRSRSYAIEPGTSGAPPLPTPPAAIRQSYGFPASTPAIQAARRASVGTGRGVRPPSESTSPRSSYSSYSQAGQGSPATYPAPPSMPMLSAPYAAGTEPTFGSGSGTGSAPTSMGPDRQRAVGVPISSSGGQNVYQMMTLETTSGTVQLPVDVQAASRVADEKRRRNAGASARFRQRRKEKEKEASTTIARLEQQVKELSEDADFYKRERDYLMGVVRQTPGAEQRHLPRPLSPRFRRNPNLAGPVGTGAGTGGAAYGGEQEEGRNVRRRTSSSLLPPPSHGSIVGRGSGYQPAYAPPGYGQPLAPQPPPSMPQNSGPLPSPLTTMPAPAPPPSILQAAPQTGPWNPYAERRPPGRSGQNERDSR